MSAAGKAETGFTLIEMLVVLAALVLIGGLVYPTMTRFGDLARLREGADRIGVTLTAARAQAIRTAAPMHVDAARLRAGGPATVTIMPAGEIVFFPDGTARGGDVEVAGGGGQLRFAVSSATGAIVRATP